MVNKKSPYYTRSEYERKVYGNKDSTTLERKLRVKGKDRDLVKWTSIYTKSEVMP